MKFGYLSLIRKPIPQLCSGALCLILGISLLLHSYLFVRIAKIQTRQRGCAGSSERSLVAHAISTKLYMKALSWGNMQDFRPES